MLDTIQKALGMPGGFENINPFDAVYSGIAWGLVETLGTGVNVLDTVGLGLNKKWKPGEKLQILFLAYSGARNTGAESRVGECIRQINQVLGADRIQVNMMTLNLEEASGYFKDYRVNLVEFNSIFFGDVFRRVLENHLIVLVEGSCWKENFATALLLYFLYGAGLASRLGKPAFAYSVEAGKMNWLNNLLSYALSKDLTRIITRSEDSARVLSRIGLKTNSVRVDTAWTMPAESAAWAKKEMKKLGWDGKKPLVGLAMQNYFWWPVIPDFVRWMKSWITGETRNQYKLVYFYDYSEEDERAYRRFALMLAKILDWVATTYDVQPVLYGMEALDENSCKDVQGLMKEKALVVSCTQYVGIQMAALLRLLDLLVTTRYHAMVLSMPACVPFIGLSRDERIRGVMKETGLYGRYYLDYREADLKRKLRDRIAGLLDDKKESKRVSTRIREHLPYYYAQMAMLGLDIRNMVRECFPAFPLADLDEDKAEALTPYIFPELREKTQKDFLELKGRA
jgi:polysaccharide pyruvyl transferase WcaK-like protein